VFASIASFLILAALLLGLPLLGVVLAGRAPAQYLEFPPVTRYVEHAPFSWPVFVGLFILVFACVLPFLRRLLRHRSRSASSPVTRRFPWWGWTALLWTAAAWVLAWNRFEWFALIQPHSFTLLWLGYIVVINALTWRRSGRGMMLNGTRYFLLLFLASAVFWWFFEYLNRFVQNWYYVGIADYSGTEYFLRATLPFATVLPAVLGTCDWLATFPRLWAGLDRGWVYAPSRPRVWAMAVLVVAVTGLLGIGLLPNLLYPLLWVAPLLLIVGWQALRGQRTIFSPVAQGDWRGLWIASLAALQCGIFWEMWNYYSLARWEYAVPYVQRFELFEMPVLGYAGYLPFGLECLAVGQWLRHWSAAGCEQ